VLNLTVQARMLLLLALVLAHWVVLIMPFAAGAFGLTPANNVAAFIDAAVFGRHLLAPAGDPEGILGTIPAVSTALLGSIAGECLRPRGTASVHLRRLAALGLAAMAAGWLWSFRLPLNKFLWTGSFVLWTGGMAALTLAACYLVLDVYGFRAWAQPFIWLGFNPLAIYFLSEAVGHLFDKPWLRVAGESSTTVRSWLFWTLLRPRTPGLSDEWLSFSIGLATAILWIGVAGVLYRRRIRLQV
jgi:predicted acyltransferase